MEVVHKKEKGNMNYKEERKKEKEIQELILKYKRKEQTICNTWTERMVESTRRKWD